MIVIPAIRDFRKANPGFFHDGALVPTPEGFFGPRFYEWLGVHQAMRRADYVSDMAQFGRPDVWVIAPDAADGRWRGDCEDLCLRGMQVLSNLEWPKSCMGIWARPAGIIGGVGRPAHVVLALDVTVGIGPDAYMVEAAFDIERPTPVLRSTLTGKGWQRVA